MQYQYFVFFAVLYYYSHYNLYNINNDVCHALSAAHLVQVGSTATGVQLSFSVELVEQTAARVQW